jgi:hypothetical protein
MTLTRQALTAARPRGVERALVALSAARGQPS